MKISDYINLALCMLSLLLAAISIVTVILTLKQNSRMIKNSTRPYIVAYGQVTNFRQPIFYVVIKNYGHSGATISSMKCSINLNDVSFREEYTPFHNIEGLFLAPEQSIICSLDAKKFINNQIDKFEIELAYSDGIDKYKNKFVINYKAYADNINARLPSRGDDLGTISYILQDLVEKQL